MLQLLVLYGSRACEHDVSIITGVQALTAADPMKYDVTPVYIDKQGRWFTGEALRRMDFYTHFDERQLIPCMLVPAPGGGAHLVKQKTGLFGGHGVLVKPDCALLAFHGMNGEDGTIQGLLELYGVPYTSAGVLGSATGMDKIAMKLIYRGCGLPVTDMCWFERADWEADREDILGRVEREIGYPAFVKPANLGSSIGISRAKDRASLAEAIDVAASFDRRILVEKGVEHLKEVNCAAVGYGEDVTVSPCEMPVSWEEFLTFDEKYLRGGKGGKGGKLGPAKAMPAKGAPVKGGGAKGMQSLSRRIPAPIPDETTAEIQRMTREIFRIMDLKGVVRVDYLLDTEANRIYVNEVNTIPGSLAFYLFEAMGIPFRELIDRMVDAAMRARRERDASTFSYGSPILQRAAGTR